MTLFSIVVPVYNVEIYLKKCVESLIEQKFQDYEIILINDGSTDSSGQICDELSKKHTQIKVIHKKNDGLSSARNVGIKNASSEWIIFMDSDDYLKDIYFLYNLSRILDKNDVAIYGCTQFADSSEEVLRVKYRNISKINQIVGNSKKLEYLNLNNILSISAWTHACRADFLRKYNLYFDENVRVGEDIDWFIRLMLQNPEIIAFENQNYFYRVRETSLSNNKNKGFWRYRFNAIEKSIREIDEILIDQNLSNELINYLAYQYFLLLSEIAAESDKIEKNTAYKHIKKLDFLKKKGRGKKVTICKFLVKLFGIKIGSTLIFYLNNSNIHRKIVG